MVSLQTSFVPPDLKAAIAEARRRQVVEKGVFDAMDFENKQKSWTVAGSLKPRLISDVQAKVNSAIEGGTSYRDFIKTMDPATVQRIATPQVVYDNAVNFAYQKGRFESQQKIKSLKPFLEYVTMKDDRVRPNHAIMEGIVSPQDSDFWKKNYPPNGHRCRCIAQARSAGDVARNDLTVETSNKEIEDRLLQEQARAGVPPNKVAVPGPDKGFEGSFKPSTPTLESWTAQFQKIEPKFTVPILDPRLPVPASPIAKKVPGVVASIASFKNAKQTKATIAKAKKAGGFVPATTKQEAEDRLSFLVESGSAADVKTYGTLDSLNVFLQAQEELSSQYGYKYAGINLSRSLSVAGHVVGKLKPGMTQKIERQVLEISRHTMPKTAGKVVGQFDFNMDKALPMEAEYLNLNRNLFKYIPYEERKAITLNVKGKDILTLKEKSEIWFKALPESYKTADVLKIYEDHRKNILKIYDCERFNISSSTAYKGVRLRGTTIHEGGHGFENAYCMKYDLETRHATKIFNKAVEDAGLSKYDKYEISHYAATGKPAELFAECFSLVHSGTEEIITGPAGKKILEIFKPIFQKMKAGTL